MGMTYARLSIIRQSRQLIVRTFDRRGVIKKTTIRNGFFAVYDGLCEQELWPCHANERLQYREIWIGRFCETDSAAMGQRIVKCLQLDLWDSLVQRRDCILQILSGTIELAGFVTCNTVRRSEYFRVTVTREHGIVYL